MIHVGHVLDELRRLPERSVQCCVTSPPYWGLRDYGLPPVVWDGEPGCDHEWASCGRIRRDGGTARSTLGNYDNGMDQAAIERNTSHKAMDTSRGELCSRCSAWRGQLGLEPTPDLFVAHLVDVFREVRRVLRDDGTCWINLGDSYSSGARGTRDTVSHNKGNVASSGLKRPRSGAKPKDLLGMPWRVALALQADGWYLRADVIWHKPTAMPSSVTDRPTTDHEYVFLLSKRERYFYDAESVKVRASSARGLPGRDAGDLRGDCGGVRGGSTGRWIRRD